MIAEQTAILTEMNKREELKVAIITKSIEREELKTKMASLEFLITHMTDPEQKNELLRQYMATSQLMFG